MEQKTYTNGEVTVTWEPNKCIHSTLCWRGLVQVFNPRKRPWIDMSAAETERIITQVKQCPSGALGYYMNELQNQEAQQTEVVVEVLPNGPLILYGTVRIKDREGNETLRNQTTALCRCGGSANKPYCDGTHKKNGFQDQQ